MEREAFPGFLRAKALGNIVRLSGLLRLIIGLFALFAGFWAGFALIFLGFSRATRCWVHIPPFLGSEGETDDKGYFTIYHWCVFLVYTPV